jgi:hypothetical protein
MHFERGERERSAVHQTIRVFELHEVFLPVRASVRRLNRTRRACRV